MWPNTFEIITALTLTVIGTIIFLYFIVLKRKGWLTDESSPEMSYLCPNPECRKVFEKPVSLTDLSTRPPRGYLACPYCGRDLEGISKVTPEESKVEHSLPLEKPQSYTENLAVRTEATELETPDSPKISKMQEVSKSTFSAGISRGLKRVSQLEKKSIKRPSKPKETPKKHMKKKRSKSRRTCSHFLGYLRTLPKNVPIPDECFGCLQLVDCVTGAKKIVAY